MPANVSDGLSFGDLILRAAVFMGVAEQSGGVEIIPTNASNLDICKRVVNDGFRRFVSAYPRWTFLQQQVSIDLVSGADAYTVPFFFSDIAKRPWSYDGQRFPEVQWTDEARVMSMKSRAEASGQPHLCCSRRLQQNTGPGGWSIVFYPTPSEAATITTTVRAVPNRMADVNDRHFAGAVHDHAVLAAVLAEAENSRDDARGVKWSEYQEALQQAIAIDQQSRPTNLGYCGNGRDYGDEVRTSPVATYNGVTISDTPY